MFKRTLLIYILLFILSIINIVYGNQRIYQCSCIAQINNDEIKLFGQKLGKLDEKCVCFGEIITSSVPQQLKNIQHYDKHVCDQFKNRKMYGECCNELPGISKNYIENYIKTNDGNIRCTSDLSYQTCNNCITQQCEPDSTSCHHDCVVGAWFNLTECTAKKCDTSGTIKQHRSIIIPQSGNGLPCPTTQRTINCQATPCDQDCIISEYIPISECSKSCDGGIREYVATILKKPTGKGKRCPALKRTFPCNEHSCDTHHQDCIVSNWEISQPCNATCGQGITIESRYIITPSIGNGKPCPSLTRTVSCESNTCNNNCNYIIGEWTPCSVTCGTGVSTRLSTSNEGSTENCPQKIETQECNTNLECSTECALSEWQTVGQCSKSCGGGYQLQTRSIVEDSNIQACINETMQRTIECQTQPCPIDCKVSAFSDWSDCSAICNSGTQFRNRSILRINAYGGHKCAEPLIETRQCNTHRCPIDCVVSAWSQWSDCDVPCGQGSKIRTRNIITPNQYGGKSCPILIEEKSCINENHCESEQQCTFTSWSNYGSCSASCGEGFQIKTRSLNTSSLYDEETSNYCRTLKMQLERKCNINPCPQDCQMSIWTQWSNCSTTCGHGYQTRSRQIIQKSMYDGKSCPQHLQERRSCNFDKPCATCPNNCEKCDEHMSNICQICKNGWILNNEGQCIAHCGENCIKCDGPNMCSQCKNDYILQNGECITVQDRNCHVSIWSEWSECSIDGRQRRVRIVHIPQKGKGTPCPYLEQVRSCINNNNNNNNQYLPVTVISSSQQQPCDWNQWSEFSTCENGLQTRTRHTISGIIKPECGPHKQSKPCSNNIQSNNIQSKMTTSISNIQDSTPRLTRNIKLLAGLLNKI